jgi:magnesium transporter
MAGSQTTGQKPGAAADLKDAHFYYFSELLNRRICIGKIKNRIGKVSDIVFKLSEPYPEAVGIFIEHGWGKPTEFVAWDKVVKIEDDAIFVQPAPGEQYPPFVDQPGWLLVNEHLIGRTILDIDGRRTEVVNDVHLLESRGRMILVHVDVSFHGFLRKWGLKKLQWPKERLISWKFVQPLSVEDAAATDTVSLSVTRNAIGDLPSEDLADALEELTGEQQQAVFSALDSEKAAETLIEAEPRARRQLIANLRKERAKNIFTEMSAAQLADLFSVLPHDHATGMMELLPKPQAKRVQAILSQMEATAKALMSQDFVSMTKDGTVGQAMTTIKTSGKDADSISYVYVLDRPEGLLVGVADLRDLVLADENALLKDVMNSPVVTAEADDIREDLADLFVKYHYRMIPVVDPEDHLLGVVRYNEIMKGLVTRARM